MNMTPKRVAVLQAINDRPDATHHDIAVACGREYCKADWAHDAIRVLIKGDLYSSLPFLTFRLPFRLFDLVPHLRGGYALVLRAVGENTTGDRVEGFQDFGHAIRAL